LRWYNQFNKRFNHVKKKRQAINTSQSQNQSLHKLWDLAGHGIFDHVTTYADFGTLLGLVRDSSLIAWDEDIDVWCWRDDFEKVLNLVQNTFGQKPEYQIFVEKISILPCTPSIYVLNLNTGVHLDIHFRHLTNDGKLVHYSCHPKWLQAISINGYQTLHSSKIFPSYMFMYRGHKICIPIRAAEILENLYGHDWTQPKRE